MIVDDDDFFVRALGTLLRDSGYAVESASDGAEAMRRLSQGPLPSAILLDLEMDGMDGFQFRDLQVEDERLTSIPTILITGLAGERVDAVQAAAVLRKPFLPQALIAAVRSVL